MAVGAGAFGAHVLSGVQADWAKTGAVYALTHAIAALTLVNRLPTPCILMLSGATIFSVTLYAMALGAPTWLGAVTPLGGALMIASWLWIALRSIRS